MNIVEQVKEKLRNCDYKVGYLTINEKHAFEYGTQLNNLGLEIVFDHLMPVNKFYLT